MSEDVAKIRNVAEEIVERGEDAIVALHSYAGLPGSQALENLGQTERQKKGLPGGVVLIVIISGYLVPEGFQDPTAKEAAPMPVDWMRWDPKDDTIVFTIEDAKRVLFNDMPDVEAEQWAKKLTNWSNGVRFGKCTYAGWRHIPTTYVLYSRDVSPFREWAKLMVDAAKNESPTAVDVVDELDSGHCPMVSRPRELVEVLVRAANAW